MRRTILCVVSVLALVLVFHAPALAASSSVSFTCTESAIWRTLTPGEEWYSDGIYHARDESLVYRSTGDPYCAGLVYVTYSYNFSDASGTGELWGTWFTELRQFRGSGFEGTFIQRLDVTADVFAAGPVVGTGYGELEGWQYRSTIEEIFPGYGIESGYAFLPGG